MQEGNAGKIRGVAGRFFEAGNVINFLKVSGLLKNSEA
jgi:hypothetical protein